MKKINAILILGLVAMLGLIVSCEQESLQETTSPIENAVESRGEIGLPDGVSIAGGRLVFEDRDVFEDFMHYLETIEVEEFLESLPANAFNSLQNQAGVLLDGEEVDEEELLTVLSERGSLQVGEYVIRLNFDRVECYVIPVSAGKREIKKMEAVENPDDLSSWPSAAQVISFEESVFDVLDYGIDFLGENISDDEGTSKLGCGESGARAGFNGDDELYQCGGDFRRDLLRADYDRYGIWFNLRVKFSHNAPNPFERANYSFNTSGTFKPKCRDRETFSRSETGFRQSSSMSIYNGTRRLSAYNLTASGTSTQVCAPNTVFILGGIGISS